MIHSLRRRKIVKLSQQVGRCSAIVSLDRSTHRRTKGIVRTVNPFDVMVVEAVIMNWAMSYRLTGMLRCTVFACKWITYILVILIGLR